MKINQAFEIIKKYGDIRTARIITNHYKKLNIFRVYYIAYLLSKSFPVAKIIHEKWFYGLPFYTNTHTLDPRPDSETLVESVLMYNKNKSNLRILDLGTGTGCLIISIISNTNNWSGIATDKSYLALKVAIKNIKKYNLDNKITTKHANFMDVNSINEKFDIIISNPPYICKGDNKVNKSAKYDPKMALYANNKGLDAYISIAKNAKKWLNVTGQLFVEIGINQFSDVKQIFEQNGWTFINAESDLSGIIRVLIFKL